MTDIRHWRYVQDRERYKNMTIAELDDELNRQCVTQALRDHLIDSLIAARTAPPSAGGTETPVDPQTPASDARQKS